MYRNQIEKLRTWHSSARRKPLILRGARQVGKSTLVRQFAKENKLQLIEVNLEKYPQLDETFKSLNISQILRSIESIAETTFADGENNLLFLDEIQATPHAIAALRYFYEEKPSLPVIAAGSLLEFVLKEHSFSMPVGRVSYLAMGPMTFEEFLVAGNHTYLFDQLSNFTLTQPINAESHQKLLELQQVYCMLGGMPESVQAYVASQSLNESKAILRSICETYKDDFSKYGLRQDIVRLHHVFDWAAKNVGHKVKYSEVMREEQSRSVKRLIDLLAYAKIISIISHTKGNGLPLAAEEDLRIFKLLFLDIGIVNSAIGTPWRDIHKPSQMLEIHQGMLAEQFVGQALLSLSREAGEDRLNYWLREGKSNNAEVDFLTAIDGRVIPVEVKAGKKGALRSLRRFVDDKGSKIAVRVDLNMPSLVDFSGPTTCDLLTLPPYAVGQLTRILGTLDKF